MPDAAPSAPAENPFGSSQRSTIGGVPLRTTTAEALSRIEAATMRMNARLSSARYEAQRQENEARQALANDQEVNRQKVQAAQTSFNDWESQRRIQFEQRAQLLTSEKAGYQKALTAAGIQADISGRRRFDVQTAATNAANPWISRTLNQQLVGVPTFGR